MQNSEILINLVDVDVHSVSESRHQTPVDLWGLAATDPHPSDHGAPSTALSLMDEELLSLGNVYLLQFNIFLSKISDLGFCPGFDQPIPTASESTYVNQSHHIPSSQVFI